MYTTEMIVSKMDHDDKKDDAASEEILDTRKYGISKIIIGN